MHITCSHNTNNFIRIAWKQGKRRTLKYQKKINCGMPSFAHLRSRKYAKYKAYIYFIAFNFYFNIKFT